MYLARRAALRADHLAKETEILRQLEDLRLKYAKDKAALSAELAKAQAIAEEFKEEFGGRGRFHAHPSLEEYIAERL